MTSKLVYDRSESARFVVSADTHLPASAEKLGAALSPLLLPGETLPDFELVGRRILRLLVRDADVMIAADLAHENELRDDPPQREARDNATADLLDIVSRIRMALSNRFGEDFGGALGIEGSAPSDPKGALAFSRSFVDALEKTTLPPKPDSFVSFDKDVALARARAGANRLDQLLDAVNREVREAEATQVAKDQAINHYDETFTVAATLMSALLTAAGKPELARRVRPSPRRPGRTEPIPTDTIPAEPAETPVEPSTPPVG